jgi:heavy metal translocating P-type ATPase
MTKLLNSLKDHLLDVSRIVLLAALLVAFNFGLPFWVFIAGVLFGVYGLATEAVMGMFKERKIGTELYITVAVAVAIFGKEYFAAGIVLMIILIAELIGDIINERARSSIKSLVDLMPKTARLKVDGTEREVPIEDLKVGDIVMVRAGDKIPVDGVVVHGDGSVNQAAITGENMPQEKVVDSEVFAGTVLQTGSIDVRVTKLKADTLFSHIIELVEEAQEKEAPIQRLTDKVAAYLIPFSFLLVLAVYFYTQDVRMVIALLIFTSPAELGLATPLVMVAGIARAAREGILLKGGIFLEELSRVTTFVFDKTGTLTIGKPQVEKIKTFNGYSEEDITRIAATANRRSSHPLADAILAYAKEKNIVPGEPTSFEVVKGRGIVATIDGKKVLLGNEALLKENEVLGSLVFSSGKQTINYLAIDGELAGTIYIADELRESAKETISALKKNGVQKIVMLTGDSEPAAEYIAGKLKIEYHANLLPQDKIAAIKEMQDKGEKVAMIGDGINDAPALAQANVGIAMGVMGNQAAMDAADVVLVGNDLERIATVRKLSQRAYRTIKENIFVGVGVVHLAGITLVLMGIIGPVQAAAIHLAPDVLVFLNSTKLLKIKL